jgi:hypothetical protein
VGQRRSAERADAIQHFKPPRLPAPSRRKITGPKKTAWTDAIFENVKRENSAADADSESARISVDTKAVINIGPYSRGGLSRGLRPVAAADHDMMAKAKLVPGGILEMTGGLLRGAIKTGNRDCPSSQ